MSPLNAFGGCEAPETPFPRVDAQHSARAELPSPNCHEPQQFCTQNYGTADRLAEVQAFVQKRLSEVAFCGGLRPLSYTVIGDRRTISRKAGLSGDEIRLASEAAHYVAGLGFRLWHAVVSDQYSDERLFAIVSATSNRILRGRNIVQGCRRVAGLRFSKAVPQSTATYCSRLTAPTRNVGLIGFCGRKSSQVTRCTYARQKTRTGSWRIARRSE